MAPYDPPRTKCHYSELDVSKYDDGMLFFMIGKGGKGFYEITNCLGLEYLWYDTNRRVIEMWGPWDTFRGGVKDKLENIVKCYSEIYV